LLEAYIRESKERKGLDRSGINQTLDKVRREALLQGGTGESGNKGEDVIDRGLWIVE